MACSDGSDAARLRRAHRRSRESPPEGARHHHEPPHTAPIDPRRYERPREPPATSSAPAERQHHTRRANRPRRAPGGRRHRRRRAAHLGRLGARRRARVAPRRRRPGPRRHRRLTGSRRPPASREPGRLGWSFRVLIGGGCGTRVTGCSSVAEAVRGITQRVTRALQASAGHGTGAGRSEQKEAMRWQRPQPLADRRIIAMPPMRVAPDATTRHGYLSPSGIRRCGP